jgi:hypothetical protein
MAALAQETMSTTLLSRRLGTVDALKVVILARNQALIRFTII